MTYRNVPTGATEPERIFKNKVVGPTLKKYGYKWFSYVTNTPILTSKRKVVCPDGRTVNIPDFKLVWEVDGVKWHSSKHIKRRDEEKDDIYVEEGFYVYRVTDEDLKYEIENVISDFDLFIGLILDERGNNPRVRQYSET